MELSSHTCQQFTARSEAGCKIRSKKTWRCSKPDQGKCCDTSLYDISHLPQRFCTRGVKARAPLPKPAMTRPLAKPRRSGNQSNMVCATDLYSYYSIFLFPPEGEEYMRNHSPVHKAHCLCKEGQGNDWKLQTPPRSVPSQT